MGERRRGFGGRPEFVFTPTNIFLTPKLGLCWSNVNTEYCGHFPFPRSNRHPPLGPPPSPQAHRVTGSAAAAGCSWGGKRRPQGGMGPPRPLRRPKSRTHDRTISLLTPPPGGGHPCLDRTSPMVWECLTPVRGSRCTGRCVWTYTGDVCGGPGARGGGGLPACGSVCPGLPTVWQPCMSTAGWVGAGYQSGWVGLWGAVIDICGYPARGRQCPRGRDGGTLGGGGQSDHRTHSRTEGLARASRTPGDGSLNAGQGRGVRRRKGGLMGRGTAPPTPLPGRSPEPRGIRFLRFLGANGPHGGNFDSQPQGSHPTDERLLHRRWD